ncbi:TRAP transporter small permease subunit, partial [Chloroflexota bacterium]
MFQRLNWLFDKALSGTSGLGMVLLILLSIFVAMQAILRTVFNTNIVGMFDLSMFALLIFPFLTMAYTEREDGHIIVDVWVNRLSERARNGLTVGVYIISILFPFVFGWQALQLSLESFAHGVDTYSVLIIPKGIFWSTISGGSFLLGLVILRKLFRYIRVAAGPPASGQAASRGIRNNPLAYILLVVVGVVVGVILFNYWHPAVILVIITLFLLFCGMPVYLILATVGMFGLFFAIGPKALIQAPMVAYSSMFSFELTASPLFILGGVILERGGIVRRLFRFF